jgi:F420H(2)-dependent quinone reductase
MSRPRLLKEQDMNSGTVKPQAPPTPGRSEEDGAHLSRMERIGLFLHRESDKRLTPLGIWVMRRTKGGIVHGRIARMLGATREVDVLLLTTHGRKSGKERTVVLQFFPDGDDLVLAAANDGGASHPAWYHNLKATPMARVEVTGRAFAVRAEELSGEEAAAFWPRLLRRAPNYERYQRATTRSFPLVRLIPQGDTP